MHDAALVRVERTELLIHPVLLHLFGEQLRHLPQLDVLPLTVLERVDEDALAVRQIAAERHVDDVLERFQRLAAMPGEQLGFVAREIDPWTIVGLLDVDRRGDAER